MEEQIPDKNLFMMCEKLNKSALSDIPEGYHIRCIREDELDLWKAFPFDDAESACEYHGFMTDFFNSVYGRNEESVSEFFKRCLFVCDKNDAPIGTCFIWKAYGKINTIHWFKVLKDYEGRGIGRALLSSVMRDLSDTDYPVYLHTQPESYRAIKLYSDFGFALLSDEKIGSRINHLTECLPILKKYMPEKDFSNLCKSTAHEQFLSAVNSSEINEF